MIDPGHGGENLGAQVDGYTEKEMTMIVAKAMKKELENYDNVVVYLTRESDQELSLEERAQFAKDRNADFLFCLHFNSSVNHNLYGSEVWVSAFGEYYSKGRSFAEINMRTVSYTHLILPCLLFIRLCRQEEKKSTCMMIRHWKNTENGTRDPLHCKDTKDLVKWMRISSGKPR